MERIIYGKKMLVADLIITSIWALFATKSTPEIEYWELAVILMRIVLSFQLFDYSRWSGYSAIIFACASTYVFLPAPGEMIYYALYIFDWNTANWFCLHPDSHEFRVCLYIVWSLLIVWLVLMPIITLSIKKIIFKFPKWSWCIIVPFAITALLGLQGYILYKYFILGIFLACFLPELYWIIVNGKKKSLANTIYRNKPLVYLLLCICCIVSMLNHYWIQESLYNAPYWTPMLPRHLLHLAWKIGRAA